MNEELVRETACKVREMAEAGLWNQQWFVAGTGTGECGTTHCFAGWALRLSGWGVMRDEFGPYMVSPDGQARRADITGAARELLGITREQGFDIFFRIEDETVDEYLAFVGEVLGLQDL